MTNSYTMSYSNSWAMSYSNSWTGMKYRCGRCVNWGSCAIHGCRY